MLWVQLHNIITHTKFYKLCKYPLTKTLRITLTYIIIQPICSHLARIDEMWIKEVINHAAQHCMFMLNSAKLPFDDDSCLNHNFEISNLSSSSFTKYGVKYLSLSKSPLKRQFYVVVYFIVMLFLLQSMFMIIIHSFDSSAQSDTIKPAFSQCRAVFPDSTSRHSLRVKLWFKWLW